MKENAEYLSKRERKQLRKSMVTYCYPPPHDECWDDSKGIGGNMEILPDQRSISYDAWAEDGYTFLTYSFSAEGLENLTVIEVIQYLNSQGIRIDLERFGLDKISLAINEVKKSSGKEIKFGLTIICGESEF